jgi:putative acetyltransferase
VSEWRIRSERPDDEAAVAALTGAAFADHPHSDGSEPTIIERLRENGELTLSLVAEDSNDAIVGHVAFSRVTIEDEASEWFGLGPLSVIPARQRCGIGSALVREGLATLAGRNASGCVVLGEPAYYGHFGFVHDPALSHPGPPAKYFQRLVLRGEPPRGVVSYASAFG